MARGLRIRCCHYCCHCRDSDSIPGPRNFRMPWVWAKKKKKQVPFLLLQGRDTFQMGISSLALKKKEGQSVYLVFAVNSGYSICPGDEFLGGNF